MPVAADIYYHFYEGGDEGQKPPVVLIHGAGGSHLYWPSEVRRLPRYRVFALDLPGHGKSGGRGQQSIPGYARSILDWLEAIDLHSAVFVGHSMGSAIVQTLALDYPEHVLGLGLIGAGARLRVAPAILESTAHSTTFHTAVEMIVGNFFGSQTSPRLVELATQRMHETRPSVLHGDFISCDGFDVSERVGEIQVPALIICGAEDKMTPVRYSQFLAAAIPHAQIEIVPGAGHMVMLEKPPVVASLLNGFLNGVLY